MWTDSRLLTQSPELGVQVLRVTLLIKAEESHADSSSTVP